MPPVPGDRARTPGHPQAKTADFPQEAGRHCDALGPRCGSGDLAKVKGCVVCLQCHYKQDCNGW